MQQGGIPSDIETVPAPAEARVAAGLQIPKLLAAIGLAASRTDADRLVKAGSVEINGTKWTELIHPAGEVLTIRAGKKWKRVDASV